MRSLASVSVVAMVWALSGPIAAAQTVETGVPIRTAAAGQQEEITVTAQRREQAVGDVAATISVIGGKALTELGALEVKDIGRLTPNVQIEGTYGNASNPIITIRGVGIEDFNDNNSSPAGVYVDEVYLSAPPMLAFGLFDMERVEVLKGPQGTLYGRNTTSGAVNFISRKPTQSFEGFARASYETFERTTIEGAVGGPISDTLAFRLAGTGDFGGDYIENRFTGDDNGGRDFRAGRLLLSWEPTSRFDVLLNIHGAGDRSDIGQYQHVGFLADPVAFTPCASAIAGTVDPRACVDPFGYSDLDGDKQAGAYNRRGQLDYDSLGGSITAKWRITDAIAMTSITAIERFDGVRTEDSDGSPNRLIEIDYGVDVEQVSQELRFNITSGSVDWIVGAYYGADEVAGNNLYDLFRDLRPSVGGPDFSTVFLARNTYVQSTDVGAIFAHGFWAFRPGWTAEAGLRVSREERSFRTVSSFEESPGDLALIGLGADGVFLDERRSIESDNVSWTLGLSRDVGRDGLVYARASNGFKSGGFNGGIPFVPEEVVPFGEEQLLAYEVGIKGAANDRRIRYDASVFYYDYEDLQVFTLADTASAVPVQVLTNAADSEIYGLDAALSWRVADGLDVNAGLGLLSATYKNADIGGRDFSGQTLNNAPKVSFTLGADYERSIGPVLGRIAFNGSYQSKERLENIELAPDRATIIEEPGYWIMDARASIASPNDRFELALFAKNLTDEQPLISTLSLPDFGFSEYTYGLPRRVGVSLTVRFGP